MKVRGKGGYKTVADLGEGPGGGRPLLIFRPNQLRPKKKIGETALPAPLSPDLDNRPLPYLKVRIRYCKSSCLKGG